MGLHLLKQYIREALSSTNPKLYGKDIPGNRSGGNVLDDEADEEQRFEQEKLWAACCLIMSDDGRVLAVSRKDDPSAFGLPGGKIDFPETAEQAAARELKEETGLTATSLRKVFTRQDDDGWVTVTFACEVEGNIDTPESGVVRWVTPEVLFNGPFGTYNKLLWAKLGLPVSER